MPRQTVERNEIGQLCNIGAIREKCNDLARDLVTTFPDVDLNDLFCIAIKQFSHQMTMTFLKEAALRDREEE